ncbi:AAA family ATPase [Kocuria rhizophila]|uniref:HelD family protein n=1 Tax=Kocuria rhizophila TaxID=72000 RepID=UPI001D4FA75C|nr:AAA family ATPase [Kocuria rhizophila]MCC5674074.1 AAA family ATPase [Kocuria rhizophila]
MREVNCVEDSATVGVSRQLEQERGYVASAYARLDELREQNERELRRVRSTSYGGGHQARSERDAFATHYEDRLAQLNAVDERLVFGRLDTTEGERHYVGRLGLATEDHRRLVLDWRAREAGAFYQATAATPMDLVRRRHLIMDGREVTALEDDVLDPERVADEDVVHGEGALIAALNSERTGRMSDIVATIQAEQDRIIRAPLSGVRVVQGGPGTGKTAVALHRAAFLLYEHRERLAKSGVLIVGPSSSFLWYIERVLPALGETGVVMSSLADLYPGVHGTVEADPWVAHWKAGLHMADVVARAVADRQKVPPRAQWLTADGHRVKLSRSLVRRARERARATGKPHNEARETFVKVVIKELAQKLGDELNEKAGSTMDRSYLREDLRQSREVRVALNLLWLPLTPQQLVAQLFSKEHYLRSAAPELDDAQVARLLRPADAPLTVADVPLLDEAAEHLGDFESAGITVRGDSSLEERKSQESAQKALEAMAEGFEDIGAQGVVTVEQLTAFNAEAPRRMTAAEAASSDRTWAYGHVVVDEAQELSPMQWRVLMRRCPLKSFTVVGDIAQAGNAAAARTWAGALEPFVGERFDLEELTVNYRTPQPIADAAARVARAAGLTVSDPAAVRDGEPPVLVDAADEGEVTRQVLACVRSELDALSGGLVGVVCPGPLIGAVGTALEREFPGLVAAGMRSLDRRIMVLTPWDAKGLEFDSVVVVEPREIASDPAGGAGNLYVAMTRPTQRLYLVGAHGMPSGIEPGTGGDGAVS